MEMFASAVIATSVAILGIAMSIYLIRKREKRELWLPLLYFSLMAVLQAFSLLYIDQCTLPANKALTFLAYLHIAFQPFFINMAAMYFIPDTIQQKISKYVYGLCWIGAGLYLLKTYPLQHAYHCIAGQEVFCGRWACAYKGNWYLAWQWPLNNLGSSSQWIDPPPKEYLIGVEARQYMFKGNWAYAWQWLRERLDTQPFLILSPHKYILGLHAQIYLLCAFALPLLYGSWRMIGVVFLFGPLIASFSTDNINEFPAILSLYAIGVCFIIINTPIRKFLTVQDWFSYHYILRYLKA